jgi:O-antigen/teichoic acid export membrane protein
MAKRIRQLGDFVRSAVRKHFWPVADQGLIAAASFATIVEMANGLSVEEFGAFTLVYSLLYFASSMQAGLITQPHNVLGAIRRDQEYVRYTTSTAVGQIALALASGLLAILAWIIVRRFDPSIATILLAAVPATIAWQLQEFARRVMYTEGRLADAFANDLIAYGGQVIWIGLLWYRGTLTASAAMFVLAACCGVATFVGFWQIRRSIGRSFDKAMLWENWHFGKWVAGGTIVGEWLSAQLLVFIAAAALGAASAGVLRAIHTLFGPARILAQVFCITLPTRLARALSEEGVPAFRQHLRQTMLLAVPLLGSYCLLVAVFAGPLLRLVFGDKYREYHGVLVLYAMSALLTYIYMIGTSVLRAERLTRPIFVSEVIYLLVVPLGALLIPLWGIHGLVVGLIVGDVVALAYVAWVHLTHGVAMAPRNREATGPDISGVSAEGALR